MHSWLSFVKLGRAIESLQGIINIRYFDKIKTFSMIKSLAKKTFHKLETIRQKGLKSDALQIWNIIATQERNAQIKRGIIGQLMISRVRAATYEAFTKWRTSSEVRGI